MRLQLALLALSLMASCWSVMADNKESEKTDKSTGLGKYRAIIDRSPFRNQAAPESATGGGGGPQQLRLNGIVRIGNEVSVGVEDTVEKKSMVVALGQTKDGLEVEAIDEKNQTATVVYNGQTLKLNLEKLPSVTGEVPPAPIQPASMQPPPAIVQPGPVGPNQEGPPKRQIINRRRIIIPREK